MNKLISILLSLSLGFIASKSALSAGTWGGQDTYHVPLSWCVLRGSPAESNPNISGDTNTDALIWRRHERPTDNIFINPTGITFRSAINDVWGTLNFPIIDDPDTSQGSQGDVRGEDLSVDATEFNDVINACDTAWSNLGRAGIGITTVNVNLFHDSAGSYFSLNPDGTFNFGYPIGWAGCTESTAGTCATPYDGRVMVADNRYFHPSSANRNIPQTLPGGAMIRYLADPLDQLTGHELGHSISLDHRTASTALMFGTSTDNSGDNQVDNIALNNTEVSDLRSNAQNVPGVEIDPPGRFDPGRYNAIRVMDAKKRNEDIERYQDIASARVTSDQETGEMTLGLQLQGLVPDDATVTDYWYFLDTEGIDRGFSSDQLKEITGLSDVQVAGADVAVRVTLQELKPELRAWIIRDNQIVTLDRLVVELQTLILHPHYPVPESARVKLPLTSPVPVHHVITVRVPGAIAGQLINAPFTLFAIVADSNGKIVEQLMDKDKTPGINIKLETPSFPHCFPEGEAIPGGAVSVRIEKLRPNAGIHALIGPDLVLETQSDSEGGGTIHLPVPHDTREGFHLVTIGVDGTALTADCILEVVPKGKGGQTNLNEYFELLKSHEDLLRRQQRLLESHGDILRELMAKKPDARKDLSGLIHQYGLLLDAQANSLNDFAQLLYETQVLP